MSGSWGKGAKWTFTPVKSNEGDQRGWYWEFTPLLADGLAASDESLIRKPPKKNLIGQLDKSEPGKPAVVATLTSSTEYDNLGRPWKVIGPATGDPKPETISIYDRAGRPTRSIKSATTTKETWCRIPD